MITYIDRLDEQAVIDLVNNSKALSFGDFILSSGEHSDYYFDSKKLTMTPIGACTVALWFIIKLRKFNINRIGGMAISAIPIVQSVITLSFNYNFPVRGFYVRKDKKKHGAQRIIEGDIPKGISCKVAIVDDVVTSGDSIIQAIEAVKSEGHEVVKVMCLLDRSQGGKEKLAELGYELESMLVMKDGELTYCA